ncbi:hypothetical protein OG978_03955 [Streptomyces sp. NBC_01591]|nr:hypothetical protein [Streptomyces sp. NBC_01591]WSD66604.1 hypothetical protein OG978_03955 [Streptomyces sp. NBC_01591]
MRGTRHYRWVVLAIATFTQAASGFFVQGIGRWASTFSVIWT